MEKGPNYNVVGKVDEQTKKEIAQDNADNLHKHLDGLELNELVELKEHECPKSPEELECIALANRETNAMLERAGVASYDFPADNIHIMDDYICDQYYGSDFGGGRAIAERQSIILKESDVRKSNIIFALVTFHEMLHIKSLFVQHAVSKKISENHSNTRITIFRKGLLVCSPQSQPEEDDHAHFSGLNEAVTAKAEIFYMQELLDDPRFESDRKKLFSPDAVNIKNKAFELHGIPEEDIINVDTVTGEYNTIGYRRQREVLDYVCNEIASDTGKTFEEVFEIFLNKQFTGHLVELGKLVEKSFGKGSFRRLGDMGRLSDLGTETLEALRKMRLLEFKKIKK